MWVFLMYHVVKGFLLFVLDLFCALSLLAPQTQ